MTDVDNVIAASIRVCLLSLIQTQVCFASRGVGTMAMPAVLGENWANVPIEGDLTRATGLSAPDCPNEAGSKNPCKRDAVVVS